jgi:hypothetical protein
MKIFREKLRTRAIGVTGKRRFNDTLVNGPIISYQRHVASDKSRDPFFVVRANGDDGKTHSVILSTRELFEILKVAIQDENVEPAVRACNTLIEFAAPE